MTPTLFICSRICSIIFRHYDNIIIKTKALINVIRNKESLVCVPRVASEVLLQCVKDTTIPRSIYCLGGVIVSDLYVCSSARCRGIEQGSVPVGATRRGTLYYIKDTRFV